MGPKNVQERNGKKNTNRVNGKTKKSEKKNLNEPGVSLLFSPGECEGIE